MTTAANKPFDAFAKSNTSVMYLHQFVYAFPEVLSRVTGDLPATMFSESNGGAKVKKVDKRSGKGKQGDANKVQASIESKNNAIEFSVLVDTSSRLSNSLREMKKVRRKMTKDFIEDVCDGDKDEGKKRIADHFEKRTKDLDTESDSEASILDEMYELEADIECTKLDAKEARQRMDSMKENLKVVG